MEIEKAYSMDNQTKNLRHLLKGNYPTIHELESADLFKEIISSIMNALHLQNSDYQPLQLLAVLNQRF